MHALLTLQGYSPAKPLTHLALVVTLAHLLPQRPLSRHLWRLSCLADMSRLICRSPLCLTVMGRTPPSSCDTTRGARRRRRGRRLRIGLIMMNREGGGGGCVAERAHTRTLFTTYTLHADPRIAGEKSAASHPRSGGRSADPLACFPFCHSVPYHASVVAAPNWKQRKFSASP